MKKKPSSAKKHKALRRTRKVNWNEARALMHLKDRIADDAAHDFIIKEIIPDEAGP